MQGISDQGTPASLIADCLVRITQYALVFKQVL